MRQFDVFEPEEGLPVCVLQSDLLGGLDTVMVAPLIETEAATIRGLAVAVALSEKRYILDIPQQFPLRARLLRQRRPCASLKEHRDAILNALNLLYWGI